MARDEKTKSAAATAQELQEEASYIRQKCNSMSMRGHYAECAKTIEENLSVFYRGERWPENFFSVLRLFQKCYPSLNKNQSVGEYLVPVLKKNEIPFVFADLLRNGGSIKWTADSFRDLAAASRNKREFEYALAYADILLKIDPGSASAHLLKGWICEDLGRDSEAASLYEQSLELNANNRFALNSLAKYYMKGSPEKALAYIEKALADYPEEASLYATKSAALQKANDPAGAAAAIEKAIDKDPYNPDYPYEKGELLFADGKRGAAVAQYRIAIALNERHVPSLLRLIEFGKDSQPSLALSYANTVAGQQPDNRAVMLIRAQLQQRLGDHSSAIKQYRELLALEPNNSDALAGLGELSLAAGNPGEAIELLEKAIALDPKNARRHYDKARAHQRLEQTDEAIHAFRASVGIDKSFAPAWAELGTLYAAAKPSEAASCLTKAIRLDPENSRYHTAKAVLLEASGDRTGAIESYGKACQYDPRNADLHYRYALLLEETGNHASAVKHLRISAGIAPTNPDAFCRLARLLQDNRPESALIFINNAVRLSGMNASYFFLKAKILESLGRNSRAVEDLKGMMDPTERDEDVLQEMEELFGGGCFEVALRWINRAVELESRNPAYLCARARLLQQLGQKDKALAQYQELLGKNPNQHEALFGMACLLAEKLEKKALEYFDRAIALAPATAEYHAGKASFLVASGADYRQAVEEYSAAIALNKQAWQVILEKARLLDAHGEADLAMEEYRHTLMAYRKCVEAAARLGVMLADISPGTALAYLDQAAAFEPENYLHYAWRGRVLYALDRADDAVEQLQQAILLGGGTAEVCFALAKILSRRIPETALQYLSSALEKEPNNPEYLLLGGSTCLFIQDYSAAKTFFRKVSEIDPTCHEAWENLAEIALLEDDPSCDEMASRAHDTKPECAACAWLRTRILDEKLGDTDSALNFINRVLDLEPDVLEYREKLVELLRKKKAFVRLFLETRRLEKLRQRLNTPPQIPEPPDFEEDDELMGDPVSPPPARGEATAANSSR